MIDALLRSRRAPDAHWEALCDAAGTTVERAAIGGAQVDRVGHAFAIGYAMALTALVGDGHAALCATEDGGNHPRAIQTRLEHGRVTGTKKWATMADRAKH